MPVPSARAALRTAKQMTESLRRSQRKRKSTDVPSTSQSGNAAAHDDAGSVKQAEKRQRTNKRLTTSSKPATVAPVATLKAPNAHTTSDEKIRCEWCLMSSDPVGKALYMKYHDEEWGRPSRDDRHLFEMLTLEGAQAGLSWITVLKKREGYRTAFDNFDVRKVASYGPEKVQELLANPGIVRHIGKINSTISNAKAVIKLQEEGHTLSSFLWQFVNARPLVSKAAKLGDLPTQTAESQAMSKALQQRGFNFVGPTICYAFMQAVGMVNDHILSCHCRHQ